MQGMNWFKTEAEIDNRQDIFCLSGSKAEGLRFKSSDEDWMFVSRFVKVLPSNAFSILYDRNTSRLLLEKEMTKPGFTLLRLYDNPSDHFIAVAKQFIINSHYLSSKLWREAHNSKVHHYIR